ncbi:glycosyltransferase [Providencia stuartii]
MTIDIILATYNGEKYLSEQINSILEQTYSDFLLYIRDDGSTDKTNEIIKNFALKDSRVIIIKDDIEPNGVGENFKQLLKNCSSNYVLLADQDDVWYENKIEELLNFANINFNNNVPCIAYSPAIVVDSNLNSLNRVTSQTSKIKTLNDMLLMNGGIQGCAMIINKKLYDIALSKNFHWYMHDQVLSLYAVSFGMIYFYNKPLFSYRQHTSNVLGFNHNNIFLRIKKYWGFNKNNYLLSSHSNTLFENFLFFEMDNLHSHPKLLLKKYIFSRKNKILFLYYIIKNKIKIRNSIYNSIFKLILVKNIVEKDITRRD